MKRAVVSAQYTKPSGLFYGGQKLQRSYEIMTEVNLVSLCIASRLPLSQVLTDVGVFDGHTTMIDVHTGLGPSGIDTLITSDSDSVSAGNISSTNLIVVSVGLFHDVVEVSRAGECFPCGVRSSQLRL